VDNLEDDVNIIVPTKNLVELERMLDEDDEKIELHIFNNKIIVKFDNILMMSRLVNGNYPDTNKLIATQFENILKVNLTEFYQAIDRASLLTSEFDKNTIKLNYENGVINISSNIPEIGHVEEKVNNLSDNSNKFKVAFSSKYMLDALKSFEGEEIYLKFNGEEKPIIINDIDSDDLIQLIVPVKTY
jgi:DNA polymerase-3 subunit beta